MNHFKPTKLGVTKALFFFIVPILAFIFSVNLFDSSKADDITTQALQTIDLSTTPAPINIFGANADDNLGGSGSQNTFTDLTRSRPLVTADFNKDGILDIAFGAPNADYTPPGVGSVNRPNTGAVYIVFGRNTFTPPVFIDTNIAAISQPDIKIYGAGDGDNVGFSLAIGDINADNAEDLLIGAPGVNFGSPSRADTGAVYVMLGSSALTPKTIDLALPNAINIAIYGEKTGDKFGSSLASGNVGGITADADILIGAPGSKGPVNDRTDAGAAYFLYGGTAFTPNPITTTRVLDLAVSPANGTIYGTDGSLLGSSVAIGDVNATSPGDLILGAPNADRPAGTGVTAADDTGAAYIIYGGANLLPTPPAPTKIIDVNTAGQSVSIYGASTGDHLGISVATGDVTGDGVSDIVLGAPDADGPLDARANSGEAYLISGSSTLPTRINVSPTSTGVALTIFGESTNDHAGSSVAIGRLNTTGNIDSIAEFFVGSPGDNANKGSVSAFYGGASLTALSSRDLALGQDDLRVLGQTTDDELGWAILATDLDGNRGGDLVLSAPFASPGAPVARPKAGRVYVILAASDTVPPINQPPLVQVTLPNGGETLLGGSTFNITWTASDPNGDDSLQAFEIRLSIDGGANYNTIIASNVSGSARTFNWTVNGGLNTNTARIRVIATDAGGLTGQDDSNANFSITDPGVTVHLLTPNGGESLLFGQTFRITWEVPPAAEVQVKGFDIFLSTDGGVNFNTSIISAPLNPAIAKEVRLFDWFVPANICSSTSRVLIVATSITGARSSDSSDANFSTVGPGPTINTTAMELDETLSRLVLRTIPPPIGSEILFAPTAVLELSSTEAGTTFFTFSKPFKYKKEGKVVITKGTINNVDLNVFFPDAAIRTLRVTNPPCGVTVLRIRRQGAVFVIAPAPGL